MIRGAAILTAAMFACLVGCAGDPAEFRPRGAVAYAPVRDAYRVPRPPPACAEIGVVHVEDSDNPIDDLAKTAARHGGTHYVVRADKTEVIGYTGVGLGGDGLMALNLESVKSRRLWAVVFRCPA